MTTAITEDGETIISCVDCEKWFEEAAVFDIRDKESGEIKYHLCSECYREQREKEEEMRGWL